MQIDLLRKWEFLITDFSLYHILESENFRFPFFPVIKNLTWEVKCEKLNFKKS